MTQTRPPTTTLRTALTLLAVALLPLLASGCAALGFLGVMGEEIRNQKPINVEAEYQGLQRHSFAAVVSADRLIQGDHPYAVPRFTAAINERLAEEAGASGYIPPNALMAYLYENPRWVAMPPSDLANDLGVERLILVEILEYRLHEPGNRYLWDGSVVGTVGVIEADSPVPDEFVFQRSVSVSFPDGTGFGPTDFNQSAVQRMLLDRFVDRVTWLFYDHQEFADMKY